MALRMIEFDATNNSNPNKKPMAREQKQTNLWNSTLGLGF